MPPSIAELPAVTASRPWALPPKFTVSAETRRLLMELVDEDEEELAEAPKIVDFTAFRQRRSAN